MIRRRRQGAGADDPMHEALYTFCSIGEIPSGVSLNLRTFLLLRESAHSSHPSGLAEVWAAIRDQALARWIRERPGTRPYAWWRFDAPLMVDLPARWASAAYASELREPRRRIGGIGTAAHDVLAYVPVFKFGLPTSWVTSFDAAYYCGLAVDVRGVSIGREFQNRPTPFLGVAVSATDPPTFESEASYLDRFGLLTNGERKRLGPIDLLPTVVAVPIGRDVIAS